MTDARGAAEGRYSGMERTVGRDWGMGRAWGAENARGAGLLWKDGADRGTLIRGDSKDP